MNPKTKQAIEETKSMASKTMSIRVPEPILELLQKNAQDE
jgi:hypothetical protein